MFFYGIKDTLANAFLQYFPAKKLELVKRDLSNVVNDPNSKSNLARNPQDFELWVICDVNEETGENTSCLKRELILSDLKTK